MIFILSASLVAVRAAVAFLLHYRSHSDQLHGPNDIMAAVNNAVTVKDNPSIWNKHLLSWRPDAVSLRREPAWKIRLCHPGVWKRKNCFCQLKELSVMTVYAKLIKPQNIFWNSTKKKNRASLLTLSCFSVERMNACAPSFLHLPL